jgi:hypothetical protein
MPRSMRGFIFTLMAIKPKKKSEFNIFSKLHEEIDDFNKNTITIAQSENEGGIRFLKGKNNGGYIYSQRQVLNLIDLYDNSKFEKGIYDSEGQRKLFLNVGKFRREVAAKQTSVKIADFVFVPDDYSQIQKTAYMSRRFKIWAREEDYGELVEELNEDYSKYGTCVSKRVGKKVVRTPIRSLKNSQDAKSLMQAAANGGYVIEEHEYTKAEMKKYKGWDLEGMKFNSKGKAKVFERYGLVPENEMYDDGDPDNYVLTMYILAPEVKDEILQKKGKIVFCEELSEDDWPYREAHWSKQDGRWLGIGEIENQFENQIAANFTANMRRRSILWAVKKVLQSQGDMIARNLVKDVKDGEILSVGVNGEVKRVDLSSQATGELNSDDQIWNKNSDQKSFTYDVITGESSPSGTPFRLGVLLTNAAASHFDRKKRRFARFLESIFYHDLIEIFKQDTKEHTLQIANNSEGIDQLKETMRDYLTGKMVINALLNENVLMSKAEAQAKVDALLEKTPYLFFEIPKGYYDDAIFTMQLDIAGNYQNTAAEIEGLTNLVTIALKNPAALDHPVIRRLLNVIMSKTGKSLDNILAGVKSPTPVAPAAPVSSPNPALPSGAGNTTIQ